MYSFGKTSKRRLETCDSRIRDTMYLAIKRSPIDFGIAQGARTVEQQQEYFDNDKSKINPSAYANLEDLLKVAKHIVDGEIRLKAEAVDVYAFVNGKASWDSSSLILIAGVILSCANELGYKLRWGGNWDGDGEIITDQKFQDFPHFELLVTMV